MATQWMKDHMTEKPKTFETNGTSYIQRKNIEPEYDEDGNIIGYSCERRFLTKEEYDEIQDTILLVRAVLKEDAE